MNRYYMYFFISIVVATVYNMHGEQNDNTSNEIREFMLHTSGEHPIQKNENPFIDPTKPKHQQSAWCNKCANLFEVRNNSLHSKSYDEKCVDPLIEEWRTFSHRLAQKNPDLVQNISENESPVFFINYPYYACMKARFAAMEITESTECHPCTLCQ